MSVGALLREFEWLAGRCTPLVAAWVRRHPVLTGCVGLRDVLAAVRADPDAVLSALLWETRAGCVVAGRVVLQALLPKIIVMSRTDRGAFAMDYVGALWLRINDYPLEERPHRIAANLALDTLKAVHAERGHGLVLLEPQAITGLPGVLDQPRAGPDTRGLLRTAVERGVVDTHTHAVLVSVFAEGFSREETAERYQVTPLTIQRRCRHGIQQLRAHADELRDAL
ncbi:MAG: hypothetical protein Q4F67_14690 [Propionibacteriaceae bacterium]|nr:hypothetical protein [Propionibacteriaceae bacterium]